MAVFGLGFELFWGGPVARADAPADQVSSTTVENIHVQNQSPGTASGDQTVQRTVISQQEVAPSAFLNETVGIKPQVGVTTRSDGVSNPGKGIFGFMLDFNVLKGGPQNTEVAKTQEGGRPFFGPSIGFFYSHIGNPGADFLGLNGVSGDNGKHMLMIPIDAKAGYTFNESVRLAGHLGVNVLYENRNATTTEIAAGSTSRVSNWSGDFHMGPDLEFGLGKNVGVLLRPDWTFHPGDTFFTGTFGLDIPIS
jgi:hypothetical protein